MRLNVLKYREMKRNLRWNLKIFTGLIFRNIKSPRIPKSEKNYKRLKKGLIEIKIKTDYFAIFLKLNVFNQ